MPIANPKILTTIPLFHMLDEHELATLANELDEAHFLAGQDIFSAGDDGDEMYVVESGEVELFLQDNANDRVRLGVVEQGDLFGEFSLLSGEERSAGARALKNTKLIIIDQNDLHILVSAHPAAALDMLAALGKRLRDSNKVVQERTIRNPNDEISSATNFGEKLSDFLTMIAGDIRFVYFSVIWFFVWIVWNINIIPGLAAFDPFPFGLLTMVVSLEAIFLSLFVLISQNRQASRDKVRNDIEYEVNLRAGEEIRVVMKQLEEFQRHTVAHFNDLNAKIGKIDD